MDHAAAAERSDDMQHSAEGSSVHGRNRDVSARARDPSEAVDKTATQAAKRTTDAAARARAGDSLRRREVRFQSDRSLPPVAHRDGDDGGGGPGGGSHFHSRFGLRRRLKRFRVLCGHFVNNGYVQLGVTLLIGVNAITMGIATFDFVTYDPVVNDRFETVDQVFLIVFTIELSLQFIYHGLRLVLDRWLLFDLVIILLSWGFQEAQVMRAFRIFRALRILTRVDTMRNLVVALFSVMPSIVAIVLMLFIIMYIFSVMFTQLFKHMYEDNQTTYDYFSRLDKTFFTLFQITTFDEWGDVTRDVMAIYPWAWLPIICYLVVSGFVVVNLIIAVICDAIAALNEDELAKLEGHAVDESWEEDEDEKEKWEKDDDGDEEEEEKEEVGEGDGFSENEKAKLRGHAVDYDESREEDVDEKDKWEKDDDGDAEEEEEEEVGEGDSFSGDDEGTVDHCGEGSAAGAGNSQMQLEALQAEIKETLEVQERTVMSIEYLTQQLQNLPTPDR